MAEKEGGLIDPEQGMAIAVRIAKIQEKKGVPFLMYDSDAEVARYLHVEQGSDESFSQARAMLIGGDMDLSPEEVDELCDKIRISTTAWIAW